MYSESRWGTCGVAEKLETLYASTSARTPDAAEEYERKKGWLWSPYVIGQTIVFLPCDFYLLSIFCFSSPNLSGRRLDVYHTSTHGVALVRI